jgi:hypothetical protein
LAGGWPRAQQPSKGTEANTEAESQQWARARQPNAEKGGRALGWLSGRVRRPTAAEAGAECGQKQWESGGGVGPKAAGPKAAEPMRWGAQCQCERLGRAQLSTPRRWRLARSGLWRARVPAAAADRGLSLAKPLGQEVTASYGWMGGDEREERERERKWKRREVEEKREEEDGIANVQCNG